MDSGWRYEVECVKLFKLYLNFVTFKDPQRNMPRLTDGAYISFILTISDKL